MIVKLEMTKLEMAKLVRKLGEARDKAVNSEDDNVADDKAADNKDNKAADGESGDACARLWL